MRVPGKLTYRCTLPGEHIHGPPVGRTGIDHLPRHPPAKRRLPRPVDSGEATPAVTVRFSNPVMVGAAGNNDDDRRRLETLAGAGGVAGTASEVAVHRLLVEHQARVPA